MRSVMLGAAIAVGSLLAGNLLVTQGAYAQSQPAPLLSAPGPKACPPDVATPPLTQDLATHPLSEQLAQSKGVICPPAGIDPGLAALPPPTNDHPIIPPPGSPGGNPTVIPK